MSDFTRARADYENRSDEPVRQRPERDEHDFERQPMNPATIPTPNEIRQYIADALCLNGGGVSVSYVAVVWNYGSGSVDVKLSNGLSSSGSSATICITMLRAAMNPNPKPDPTP